MGPDTGNGTGLTWKGPPCRTVCTRQLQGAQADGNACPVAPLATLSEPGAYRCLCELGGTEDFFPCIWHRHVLEFQYSTCCSVAFGSLWQVLAAVAVVVCVSADDCSRATCLRACKSFCFRNLSVGCPRSSSSSRTEVCTLSGATARRHTWEMIDCRWPDRRALAEKTCLIDRQRGIFCRQAGSPTTAEHLLQDVGAILGQGGPWFAVDVGSTESVNTWGRLCPGHIRKGGGNPKSRA